MSGYKVIWAVSKELRRVLWEEFDRDTDVRPIVGSDTAIVFSNPTETRRQPSNRLSLWLYRVTENEHVKNSPTERANGAGSTRPAPLALNLDYLVTPFASSGEFNDLLLGKTMQVLYDNASMLLRDPADQVAEELRVVLAPLTLEELTRVWEALQEPYRLSIAYEVRVTRIESLRVTSGSRVIDRNAGFRDRTIGTEEEARRASL
jgi:hypothetical protein